MIACLHAGINQFLDTWKDETHAALKEGSVSEAEIDGLLRRKFVISLKLGLLDPGQEDFTPAEIPGTRSTPTSPGATCRGRCGTLLARAMEQHGNSCGLGEDGA